MALPLTLRDVEAAGGKVFINGDINLNIIGIRTPDGAAVPGTFDDVIEVWYRKGGRWLCESFPVTTEPGRYWLEHPMRVEGTAILCPGQYRGAYRIGKHKGQYKALVQRGPVKVWRDNNRNDIIDINPGAAQIEGLYGINIHASDSDPFDSSDRERGEGADVGKWSAGCQVFANSSDYRAFWKLIERAAKVYGDRFTYTLIER